MFLGRFILNSDIFKVKNKLVYHSNELQLPTALLHFKDQVRCVVYEGMYFNIDSKLGYLKANIYFGLKRSDMHDEILSYIKSIEFVKDYLENNLDIENSFDSKCRKQTYIHCFATGKKNSD